jgi:hypothetical protein
MKTENVIVGSILLYLLLHKKKTTETTMQLVNNAKLYVDYNNRSNNKYTATIYSPYPIDVAMTNKTGNVFDIKVNVKTADDFLLDINKITGIDINTKNNSLPYVF